MQFLSALLAYAAVMALLSTVVAVAIEAFISAGGMRRKGLRRLLEGYYRAAVVDRLPPDARPQTESDQRRAATAFAQTMVRNPARLGRSGESGGAAFTHLTPRQLIEQLARTDAGREMLKMTDPELRRRLEALAYEFDRFSEGARTFFTRRTRLFAIPIAILMAFTLNVDALRLYRVLATQPAVREALIAWGDRAVAAMDAGQSATDAAVGAAGTEASDAAGGASTRDQDARADGGGAASGNENDAIAENKDQQELNRLISLLGTVGVPVGYSQYPHCSLDSAILGRVEPGNPVYDPRCTLLKTRIDRIEERERRPRPESANPVGAAWNAYRGAVASFPANWRARIHLDTAIWFFSTLIAGGMIGLGAPFWFNVYRRLAMMIPVAGAASAFAAQFRPQATQGEQVASTTATPGRRDDVNVREDDIVVVARTSGGDSPPVDRTVSPAGGAGGPNITGYSPPGVSVGAGSAQRVGAGASTVAGDTAFRMRRLRG